MTNTGDRKSVRAAEKSAEASAARRASVTRSIMSTAAGREWMWDVLAASHIFGNTFFPDPHQSAFAQGERNAGLRLLADIMLNCPDQFIQAQREANERSNLSDARDARDDTTGADERRSGTVSDGRDHRSVDSTAPVLIDDDTAHDPRDDGWNFATDEDRRAAQA